MHTIMVTLLGFLILGVMLGITRPSDVGARRFIPVWLMLCIVHLGYGVLAAGYGLIEELGVHAVVFGLPAAVAFVLARTLNPKA